MTQVISLGDCINTLTRFIEHCELKREVVLKKIPLYDHISFIAYDEYRYHCTTLMAGMQHDRKTNLQRDFLATMVLIRLFVLI